jgi:hypothetical protein
MVADSHILPVALVPPQLPAPLRLQRNFGRPVEWELVKDYPWSAPQLRRVEAPTAEGSGA